MKGKRGSITVFLALILGVMMMLLCACMQSVRIAAARTRVLCAAEIGLYNATRDKTHQEASVAHLEKALEYWKTYAQDFAARYRPQMMARLQLVTDPGEYTSEAERDISIAQKWRIR